MNGPPIGAFKLLTPYPNVSVTDIETTLKPGKPTVLHLYTG
jgi:hypothetical protein